ncbi:ABC transporter ATP-binding protein [Robbsia andropogonis]|uniref:ABC transporter ATP-binding protein n=1 Tax=Robbsia andropogonis TaxID=28092 RepID=UPI003D1C94E7
MAAGDSPSVSTARPRGASVAIHIDQLSHAFIPASTRESDSAWVLDDLTLCVPAGTTMALLGPSGCGKSTLLKLLAGLLRPTCGAIRFGDRLVATGATRVGGGMVITRAGDAPVARRDVPRDAWMAPEDRSLGMVFQDYALWPHMTVAGNVSFPLEMRGIARAARRERVNEALAMVGLAHLADRRPQALSGGQQQRVAPPARSSPHRTCCCSTNRYRISIAICAPACAKTSARCCGNLAPRRSTLPTIRKKRMRWLIVLPPSRMAVSTPSIWCVPILPWKHRVTSNTTPL